jgi:CMP-N,N'-diacetyllegionaminic acid synthase
LNKREGAVLGLIPARGGSKGLPLKNLRPLFGKPLIVWAVESALACFSLDSVWVSTDSDAIARAASAAGAEVPFIRPTELALDSTPMMPVMQHATDNFESFTGRPLEALVLLDPTSPMRLVEDVEAAISLFFSNGGCDAVVSGCEARRHPHFNLVGIRGDYVELASSDGVKPTRRQDCPTAWDLDTTVWVYSRQALAEGIRIPERTRFQQIPRDRSWDVDNEADLRIVECLMRSHRDVGR